MEDIEKLVALYKEYHFRFERFLDNVKGFFEKNPELHVGQFAAVHSVKGRLKNEDHLRDKLTRKANQKEDVNEGNFFQKITDLAGVRVLHIFQRQFEDIHAAIMKQVEIGEWVLGEDPVAYSWDPEAKVYFESIGITTKVKDTFYTSVHYLVRPKADSPICCEIQVRTLFEEVWGEIDHSINYPHPINDVACTEELRVLSKYISTGSRLADAILRSFDDYKQRTNQD